MYTVIVVDDEPTALNHICMIIEKKCRGYKVIDTADNGLSAYEKIMAKKPDIVIADVKMPIMDGIEMTAKVKKDYPEILTVIVSGYQDFDYAKGAIQSGVCDYLLKPLKPLDLKELMEGLSLRLKKLYYEKRCRLLRNMCSNLEISKDEELKRYFTSGNYYSAVIRKNGLPRRFSQNTDVEIFSMEEEKIYIYGRDEMESLYLFPEELLADAGFEQVMQRIFEREKNEYTYITAVIYDKVFTIEKFPSIIRKLYRRLDESVIIGHTQFLKENSKRAREAQSDKEKRILENIAYLIKHNESQKLRMELEKLFGLWEEAAHSQLYIEGQIRYIFQLIKNAFPNDISIMEEKMGGIEFLMEDTFFYASNMRELKDSIYAPLALIFHDVPEPPVDDKEQMLRAILSYINEYMDETITLGHVCKEFGISQATLSKMFRTYQNCSFGNYLTKVRIEKAKEIMSKDSGVFIKDIAKRVGYEDQFYFSRIFRSVVGSSPSEYLEGVNSFDR